MPSFQMAYSDPSKDVDVSAQMEYGGVVEMGLTQMWLLALKDHCIQRGGKRALVLDVGANFGWYSMYAAKLGCRYAGREVESLYLIGSTDVAAVTVTGHLATAL